MPCDALPWAPGQVRRGGRSLSKQCLSRQHLAGAHAAQVSQVRHVLAQAAAIALASLMQNPPTCCRMVIKSRLEESGASVITLNQAHRFGYDSQFGKECMNFVLDLFFVCVQSARLVNFGFYRCAVVLKYCGKRLEWLHYSSWTHEAHVPAWRLASTQSPIANDTLWFPASPNVLNLVDSSPLDSVLMQVYFLCKSFRSILDHMAHRAVARMRIPTGWKIEYCTLSGDKIEYLKNTTNTGSSTHKIEYSEIKNN